MDAQEQQYYEQYRCDGAAATVAPLCSHFGIQVAHAGELRGKIVRATRSHVASGHSSGSAAAALMTLQRGHLLTHELCALSWCALSSSSAARPIACGEVAWVEEPLVAMAHLSSARMASGSCCARCLRPVGSLQEAWERGSAVRAEEAQAARRRLAKKLAAKNKSKSKKAAPAPQDPVAHVADAPDEPQLLLPAELPCLSEAAAASADAASATASSSDASVLHLPACAAVPCVRGCGEVYCSTQCRDLAFANYHELLCPGTHTDVGAACAALAKHAASNNEIFLLAGQAVARMTLGALRRMREVPAVAEALATGEGASLDGAAAALPFALRLHAHLASLDPAAADSLRASLSCCAAEAAAPFRRFCGGTWWEHVSLPGSVCPDDPDEVAEYRQALCGVAEQSLTLLSEVAAAQMHRAASASTAPASAPAPSPPSWEDLLSSLGLDELWSLSLFAHVLSSFERNNIGIHAPTSLGLYVAHVRGLEEADKARAVEQLGNEVWMALQRRADGTDASAAAGGATVAAAPASSVEGTGLFVVGCCMNHSCSPNISLRPKFVAADEAANEMNDPALMGRLRSLLLDGSPDDGAAAAASSASASTAAAAAAAVPAVLLDRSAMFVALRDIAAGEELNISYIDLLQPASGSADSSATEEVGFDARQQQLRAYDFDCRCTKCAEQGSATAAASHSSS